MARREVESQRQLVVLQKLVDEIHRQGDATAKRADRDRDVKLAKFSEGDDVEAYLTTFERLMQANEIPAERWSYRLAPNLTGKAQQAFTGGVWRLQQAQECHPTPLQHQRGELSSTLQDRSKEGGRNQPAAGSPTR